MTLMTGNELPDQELARVIEYVRANVKDPGLRREILIRLTGLITPLPQFKTASAGKDKNEDQ